MDTRRTPSLKEKHYQGLPGGDDRPPRGQHRLVLSAGEHGQPRSGVRGETTRSVSSSAVPIATETRTTSTSKSSRPSFLRQHGM
jgi:hypothetical protein